MADYLVVIGENPNHVKRVEARNLQGAIESLGLSEGEKCTVYRVAGDPRDVSIQTETVTRLVVSEHSAGNKENK